MLFRFQDGKICFYYELRQHYCILPTAEYGRQIQTAGLQTPNVHQA